MPGPSKKPAVVKSLRGTKRKDRAQPEPEVSLDPLTELPDAPDWLPNSHAVKEWERLGPILISLGLLTDASLSPFAHMCALHGKVLQLWNAGETPTGHLYSQYLKFCDGFGLTPASLGKVGAGTGGQKKPGNKFSGNGKRA